MIFTTDRLASYLDILVDQFKIVSLGTILTYCQSLFFLWCNFKSDYSWLAELLIQCYEKPSKWTRICSVCPNLNPDRVTFTINYRILSKSNTTSTSEAGTATLPDQLGLASSSGVRVTQYLLFCVVLCRQGFIVLLLLLLFFCFFLLRWKGWYRDFCTIYWLRFRCHRKYKIMYNVGKLCLLTGYKLSFLTFVKDKPHRIV